MTLDPRTITRSTTQPENVHRLSDYYAKPAAIERRPVRDWQWPSRYAAEQGPGMDYEAELADGFALKYGAA